ncbi:MAG: D-alanine--D-alanine ligase [Clostridia bacterium]|nr:D-alanine--D-alanine ligase [Clostridia bacterium]
MKKLNVGIIFGGVSTEHEVSRRSAVHIIKALDKSRFGFALFEIAKNGDFYIYENPGPDLDAFCANIVHVDNRLSKIPAAVSGDTFREHGIDVVFPVIHGTGGEDGVLQGFLETLRIPYVGGGVLSSALCFDKAFAKIIFAHHGIPQVEYICATLDEIEANAPAICMAAAEKLGFPVFVKPANGGSSVGIYKTRDSGSLEKAMRKAAKYDRKVLIEKGVAGRELECAVFGGYEEVLALGVGEVVPCNEFYDYNAKYIDKGSKVIIPAAIDDATAGLVKETAVRAFKALDCHGLARIDFFLAGDGAVYLNEINTMPGFTSISMYPKLWEACGNTGGALVSGLIDLAFEKKEKYAFLKDYSGVEADEQ